ncbi:hypothetical protein ABZ547_28985 [Streptomyces sparsogenes]|uniref:hypothetical protein n=1 Tax=Streptomyces sparsogenes TaxID=67365 RepID=UPI0033D21020
MNLTSPSGVMRAGTGCPALAMALLAEAADPQTALDEVLVVVNQPASIEFLPLVLSRDRRWSTQLCPRGP